MTIITLVQSLCLGRPPLKPAAKTALELCTPVAIVIDRDCHCSNRPAALACTAGQQLYDKHKHRSVSAPLNW